MKNNSDTPIITDVVDGEAAEADLEEGQIELTPREALLEKIADERQEEIEDEIEEEDAPVEKDEDLSKTEEEDEIIADDVEKKEKVVVKIDGVEEEVSPEEIREYQKNRSADKRMREVSEQKKVNDAKEAELKRLEQEVSERTSGLSDEKAKELAARLNQAVFDENPEETAKVMQEISKNTPERPAASAEINDAAVDRVLYRKEQKKAIAKFEKDYENLATDPDLRSAVNRQSIEEKEKDPNASVWEIINRSAVHVKDKIAQKLGLKEEPEPKIELTELEKRRKKKAEANDSVESTSSLKSSLTPRKKKQLSAFDELKKSRGQR